MRGLAVFLASFGYVGFFPIAPGTAGSLAALALFAFIRWIGVPAIELGAIVAVFAIGVWAAHGTETQAFVLCSWGAKADDAYAHCLQWDLVHGGRQVRRRLGSRRDAEKRRKGRILSLRLCASA